MDDICTFLRSCLCSSLKAPVIIIAVLGLAYDLLYYLDSLVRSIEYIHKGGREGLLYFYSGIELFLFESNVCLNIIFWIYLLYGTIKETPRKSSYIFAWIVYNFAYIPVTIISLFTLYVVYKLDSPHFLTEEVVILGLTLFEIVIVYRYYRTVPKQKSIYSIY